MFYAIFFREDTDNHQMVEILEVLVQYILPHYKGIGSQVGSCETL